MEGFKTATFGFGDNGDFNLSTESKAPAFQMMLRMMENAKWKFDAVAQRIKIGTIEDGYSVMGINVTQYESEMNFSLEESQLTFEMEKIDK